MKKRAAISLIVAVFIVCAVAICVVSAQEPVQLPIIMYHSVVAGNKNLGDYVINVEQFENDIKCLKEAGFESVTIEDLIKYTEGGELPENPIMITFDDGYYNNVNLCGPILEKYQMRAVISVVGIYTDNEENCTGKRSNNYSYLTWEEIESAQKSGIFEVQNHSYNMHGGCGRMGAQKSTDEDVWQFKDEVAGDISRMQNLLRDNSGVNATCFTYPYGSFDEYSKEVVKECGFLSSMNCFEEINTITRDKDCLYGLGRYNRPSGLTTWQFFNKMGISL